MNIESFVKLFETYGWEGVVAAGIIAAIYYFVTKQNKKQTKEFNDGMSNLATAISKQNEKLIDKITESNEKSQERLVDIVMHALETHADNKVEAHKESLDARDELGKFVDTITFDMLNIFNAQRIVVIEFHNSKENFDGLAFTWYDVQYEKQQRGVQPISNKARNLQATNLRPIIERVNKAPNHIIVLGPKDIEDIYKESTVLYAHLDELEVEHMIYCGIYNQSTHQLIGLVGIEYQKDYPYHEDLIDTHLIAQKVGLIEHKYNTVQDATN